MQINKFKKIGKNKYKIIFDNTDITLYEDIILKYNLLIKKELDEYLLDKIINENLYYDAYDKALGYIEIKLRTKVEIEEYLNKKGFDEKIKEYVIEKLESSGLLNNEIYTNAYINDKINLSLDGPFKIKNDLIKLGIDENIVDKYLNKIDYDIWKEKIDKIINKKKSSMNNKSYYMFINKLKNELYNKGYEKELIEEKLSKINYESNAIIKDMEKSVKKYKNDKNKIISYLIRKGYSYEEIKNKLNIEEEL